MPKPTSANDKRLTPEFKENLKKRGFQKGRAKTGGTVAIPADVKEALRARTPEAIDTLFDILLNSSNDNARVKAAAYFLDPFVPKAATTVDVNHKHSIADLLTQANKLRLKDSNKTIDITPVIIEPENALPSLRIRNQRSGDDV